MSTRSPVSAIREVDPVTGEQKFMVLSVLEGWNTQVLSLRKERGGILRWIVLWKLGVLRWLGRWAVSHPFSSRVV